VPEHIVRERTAIDRQRVRQGIRYKAVYIAGILACLLIFAVQTGTRYVMNDWSRDKLERVMSVNLHRRVSLGRATWSLGLNGLIIAVERMIVYDRISNDPFITSDYSEIGVPLLPMLAGYLEARSMTFTNPKVYAVKIGKTEWNFSDLPDVDSLRDVSYVDLKGGELHVIDRSNNPPATWSPRVFANADFHLERPFANRTWPFSLSFRMPHQGYVTNILLTGIGNGNIHDFEKNNHQFDLKATNVNLLDFSDAFPQVPPILGRMNVEVHGEGIPQKGFNVDAVVRSPEMTVATPGFGALTIRNATTSGHLTANENMLRWRNVIVNLGPKFIFQTNGDLRDWKTKQPRYEVTTLVQADDINKLAQVLPAQILPRQLLTPHMAAEVAADTQHNINITQALAPVKLTGSVIARARIKGHGKQPDSIWADVDARGVSMSHIADLQPLRGNPAIAIISANPRSMMNMHVTSLPNGEVVVDRGRIAAGNSAVNFSGTMQPKTNDTQIKFTSRHLNLAELAPSVRETAAMRKLNKLLGLPLDTKMQLSGFVDVTGNLSAHGNTPTPNTHVIATVRNTGIALGNGELRATRINGKFAFDGRTLLAQNVHGYINNGAFELQGMASTNPNGPVNLSYRGKTIDLAAVKEAAATLHINSPLINNRYLRGNIDDVDLVVTGTVKKPRIFLDGQPRQVAFQPPGAKGAVLITGGTFKVVDNQVLFNSVKGTIGGGTFVIGGTAGNSSSNIVLAGRMIDISQFRQAMIDLHVNAPIITAPEVLFGTMRTAVLTIRTTHKNSQFSLSGSPLNVYYQTHKLPRAFVLTGGNLQLNNSVAVLHHLRGRIGTGTFALDGTAPVSGKGTANLTFEGRNIDLSNAKASLQALNVKSPMLAQQMLYGKVSRLTLGLKGNLQKPDIRLTAYPTDVRFEPFGSKRTMRVTSGVVTYANDTFTGKNLTVINSRSKIWLSARIEHLSAKSRLTDLHLKTNDLDFADLNAYLVANSTPATLRQPYLSALKRLDLADPRGTLVGQLDYTRPVKDGNLVLYSNLAVKNVGFTVHGMNVHDVNGAIVSNGTTLVGQNFSGSLEDQPLTLAFTMKDLDTDTPAWTAGVQSNLDMKRVNAMLPSNLSGLIQYDEEIPVDLAASGVWGTPKIAITGKAIVANTPITLAGEYMLPVAERENEQVATMDMLISFARPINAHDLVALIPSQKVGQVAADIAGQVGGQVHLFGPVNALATQGHIDLYKIAIPSMRIDEVSGSLRAQDASGRLMIDIDRLTVANVRFENVQGDLLQESTADGDRWTVENLTASLYGGTAEINGNMLLNAQRPFEASITLCGVDAEELTKDAVKAPSHGVTGKLSAYASVTGNATSEQELLQSLNGTSHFSLTDGRIKALAQLEGGLELLDIAHEGIFGTSIGDLLGALGHFHTGSFNSVTGNANVQNGVVDFNQLSFIGPEMRLRAQGDLELETRNAKFEVAGNIPRNASHFKGPIGALLQHLSIANIVNTLTFGLTSHLPNIPLLGKLGVDRKPRAFQFIAQGNLDDPNSFTKSVLHSFHWLPNERFATPHPVFGIGASPETVPQ
jgi:hypothetical protein